MKLSSGIGFLRLTPNRVAALIAIAFALLASVYASQTPIFEAPDEAGHFLYMHNMLVHHALPVMQSYDVMFKRTDTPPEIKLSLQIHHPPLYYLIGAALISWTERKDLSDYLIRNPLGTVGTVSVNNQNGFLHLPQTSNGDTSTAVAILRLYSILLAVGTLLCVYRTGLLAFNARVGLLAMLIIAMIPSFIFISSSINNDNLVTFLYSTGIMMLVSVWQRRTIRLIDMLILSLILAAIALSKLPGLTLFGVIYGWLGYGALWKRFRWREVLQVVVASAGAALLFAGWWYLRNFMIYGDPFGLQATLRLWGRGALPTDPQLILSEAKGVWDSLWMILGQFNIRGADWVYSYAALLTIVGLIGCGFVIRAQASRRSLILLFFGIIAVVIAALIYATRQVNVSQGRILFPMLVAFGVLLAAGWYQMIGRRSVVVVVPFIIAAFGAPIVQLPNAFVSLQAVSNVPDGIHRIDAQAETLSVLGYTLQTNTVRLDDVIRLTIYVKGQHVDNPVLFVKALDPVSHAPLGGVDLFPGMSPTSALDPTTIYGVSVVFPIKPALIERVAPYQLDLQIGWRNMGNDRFLPLQDQTGAPLRSLIVPGPTLIGLTQSLPASFTKTNVQFGDIVTLTGYEFVKQPLTDGTLQVRLFLHPMRMTPVNYTAAIGLLDEQNNVVTSVDGYPVGYPSSAWRIGADFIDERLLSLPSETTGKPLRLYLGWYDGTNGTRLPATGDNIMDGNLFVMAVNQGS